MGAPRTYSPEEFFKELSRSLQATDGAMPSVGDVTAAKEQQRGAGIPVIVGAAAGGQFDASALCGLEGALVDGFATAFSDLASLAAAAEPEGLHGTPGECVTSVLGKPFHQLASYSSPRKKLIMQM